MSTIDETAKDLPSTEIPTEAPPERPWARRAAAHLLRTVLGLSFLALAGSVVANPLSYRSWETAFAVPFAGLVTPGSVLHSPGRDVFVVGADTPRFWTFQLTAECTSAILIVPLLAIGGLLLVATRRFAVWQVLRAVAVTAAIVLAVNVVRLMGIAWASMTWDDSGYQASHTFVGSGFSFVGFCFALVLGARSLLSHGSGHGRA